MAKEYVLKDFWQAMATKGDWLDAIEPLSDYHIIGPVRPWDTRDVVVAYSDGDLVLLDLK